MSTESQDSFLSFRSQLTFEAEVIVVLAPEFLRLAVKRLQIRDAAMFPLLQNYLLRLRNETSRLLFLQMHTFLYGSELSKKFVFKHKYIDKNFIYIKYKTGGGRDY